MKSNKVQFSVHGDKFFPSPETVVKLPSGYYEMTHSHDLGYGFKSLNVVFEETILFPKSIHDNVLNDIRNFWNSKGVYKSYGYTYKRGILLHGPPGCGKTCIINLVCQELLKSGEGIILTIASHDDLWGFKEIRKEL